MNFSFQHTQLFWLWLLIPGTGLLFALYLYWKKRTRRKIGDPALLREMTATYSPKRFYIKYGILFAGLVLGILAALNPGRITGDNTQKRQGIDLAIALDVSKSMLATDMPPNRLERARQLLYKLMESMPDDRISLVLFAGKAYTQMPLTTDHGAAKLFIAAAGPEAVPGQGTVISDALEMASRSFNNREKRFKTILLVSDGEDHDRNAGKTAKELARQGIMIITVGIGSGSGATIPDPLTGQNKLDESGNPVISKLNEDLLREIAGNTNGLYLNLQNTETAVSSINSQLAQIERKAFTDISLMNFKGIFTWLALSMFLCLLAEPLVPGKRRMQA